MHDPLLSGREMQRRDIPRLAIAVSILGFSHSLAGAHTGERLGFLILHGKNPGGPYLPNFKNLIDNIQRENWLFMLPDMPWSRGRYLEGDWDQAMQEIANHVNTLKGQGATKIILIGHSMGCPAAMSYVARGGDASALALLAPGHSPHGYYTWPVAKAVRESIDEARALVASGQGEEGTYRFYDLNQGQRLSVVTTAKNYLSYFDPQSDAEMGRTASKIPTSIPVLTVIGEKDPLFKSLKNYYVKKLPPHPLSDYIEVAGGHMETPNIAADKLIAWVQKVAASLE